MAVAKRRVLAETKLTVLPDPVPDKTDRGGQAIDEMIEYLVKLSVQKGRAVTYLDFKKDSNIDLEQLKVKLGSIVAIENRVRRIYEARLQQLAAESEVAATPMRVSKIPANYRKAGGRIAEAQPLSQKRLTSFGIPAKGELAQLGNEIIFARLDANGSECVIQPNEVIIKSGPEWLQGKVIEQLFAGWSQLHEITLATIYEDGIVFRVRNYYSEDEPLPITYSEVVITFRQNDNSQYMLALYLIDSNEICQDYLRFHQVKETSGTRIMIDSDERRYAPPDRPI